MQGSSLEESEKKKIKKTVKTNINDVVMIKGVEKNQGKWEI